MWLSIILHTDRFTLWQDLRLTRVDWYCVAYHHMSCPVLSCSCTVVFFCCLSLSLYIPFYIVRPGLPNSILLHLILSCPLSRCPISSFLVLSYLSQFNPVLSCSILSCPVLFSHPLSYLMLSYSVLSCHVFFLSYPVLSGFTLSLPVHPAPIPSCHVPFFPVLPRPVLSFLFLSCSVSTHPPRSKSTFASFLFSLCWFICSSSAGPFRESSSNLDFWKPGTLLSEQTAHQIHTLLIFPQSEFTCRSCTPEGKAAPLNLAALINHH